MNVYQMEDMDPVTRYVQTLLDHFPAVANQDTILLGGNAWVRELFISLLMH